MISLFNLFYKNATKAKSLTYLIRRCLLLWLLLFLLFSTDDILEGERGEGIPDSFVKLRLELHPAKYLSWM